MDQGDVPPLHLTTPDHLLQPAMDGRILCHYKQAAGITIEPVHDSRPVRVTSADPPPAERIHKSARGVAGSRMHYHAGRLVHHEELIVLVRDRDRQVLGKRQSDVGSGQVDDYALARRHFVALKPRHTLDRHGAGLRQHRGLRTAAYLGPATQEAIHPQTIILGPSDVLHPSLSRWVRPRLRATRSCPKED